MIATVADPESSRNLHFAHCPPESFSSLDTKDAKLQAHSVICKALCAYILRQVLS